VVQVRRTCDQCQWRFYTSPQAWLRRRARCPVCAPRELPLGTSPSAAHRPTLTASTGVGHVVCSCGWVATGTGVARLISGWELHARRETYGAPAAGGFPRPRSFKNPAAATGTATSTRNASSGTLGAPGISPRV
jgi:hypothetical protein